MRNSIYFYSNNDTAALQKMRKKNVEKVHSLRLWRRATLFSLSGLPHLFRCLYTSGLKTYFAERIFRMTKVHYKSLLLPVIWCLIGLLPRWGMVGSWIWLGVLILLAILFGSRQKKLCCIRRSRSWHFAKIAQCSERNRFPTCGGERFTFT